MARWRRGHLRVLVVSAVALLALGVRAWLVPIRSGDYVAFVLPWYEHLADHGGFAGLGTSFSNYDTPYLVLLAALTYVPLPPLVAVKLLSTAGDLVIVFLVHRIVARMSPAGSARPLVAACLAALLPTVLMNSAAWGQCDSLYVASCVGSLLALTASWPTLACALFALGLALKLQAVFFAPVLVIGLVVGHSRWRSLVAVPVVFLATLVPAWLAGRGLVSQLLVYPRQVARPSGAVGPTGGRVPAPGGLTFNAPTPYAWLPTGSDEPWRLLGLTVAALVVAGITVVAIRRGVGGGELVLTAATLVLVGPLLLPFMHDRYFYLAEVLSLVAAFVDRRFAAVAVALQLTSLDTYLGFLRGQLPVPLGVVAAVQCAAALGAVIIWWQWTSGARTDAQGQRHQLSGR